VESEASVEARIAAQNERRRQIEAQAKPAALPKPVDLTIPLQNAWRAFAAGDFAKSEQLLTQILATNASAEAYLLRGCARYTAATLARGKLDAAAEDFRAALALNPALRLDRSAFSPKLIAYFEQLRAHASAL
jgi:tetratricopeptide (TPR) repeat protein